ncbi:ACP S-malonyltransferase [Colwelliaceae bacterium 6441]
MKTYMFPGQGSQSKGMGGELFDEYAELTAKADKILGYSIKELCLEDPKKQLNKTQFTQPALYVVNAFSYYKKIAELGTKPDYVIGHSLGEFNALLAAECFDFEAGLKLVKKRGELMSEVSDGGMAAILNASKEQIEEILATNNLTNIDLANYNSPSQIVISGLIEEIGEAQAFFQQGDILYYPLNTSGAFHSRFMQPSKEKFQRYLNKFKLNDLNIPVISNVTAVPYNNDEVIRNLPEQITSTVRWSDSVQYLLGLSADMEFEEIGNGDVLTKIVRTIKQLTKNTSDQSLEGKSPVKKQMTASNKASKDKTDEKVVATDRTQVDILVNEWNQSHPVGTRVTSTLPEYDELETRTEAVVLFGHRAAVYMKGYNGYFDLNELTSQ